jgi:hypothetical protein
MSKRTAEQFAWGNLLARHQSVSLAPVSPDRCRFFVIVVSQKRRFNSIEQLSWQLRAGFVVAMNMDGFEQDQPFTF